MAKGTCSSNSPARTAFLFRSDGLCFAAGRPGFLPLIDVCGFYHLRPPQQQFPGHAARRLLFRGFPEFVRFFFQPLREGLRVLDPRMQVSHVAGSL